MITIELSKIPFSYSKEDKAFTISERDVQFATDYFVISPETGKGKEFRFSHSTGPEFASDTQWVYESGDGIKLKVCNDPAMVKTAAAAYMKGKLGK